jgi:hypothetical protein
MNAKYLKILAVFAAVLAGAMFCINRSAQAQDKPVATQISTNWVGGLVIGKREKGDPIAGRGMFPHADADIEIGLRSDGVVVWRNARP